MTNLEWEKKFDEEFPYSIMSSLTIKGLTSRWKSNEDIKQFISQTHKDLVEAILEEIPDVMWPPTGMGALPVSLVALKQSLRAKYLKTS